MRRCFPAVLLFLQGALGSSETVGNVRIHALSPSLVRIEPKGPSGFEDRPTFGVVGRNAFEGTNLTVVNTSAAGTWMKTPTFFIFVNESSSALMEQVQGGVDVRGAKRSITYPFGTHTKDEVQCFKTCENDTNCLAWVFHHQSLPTPNCWPLGSYESRVDRADRSFGCLTPGCLSPVSMVTITSLNGTVLWTHVGQPDVRSNLLDWPAPLSSGAYAVMDYPRIVVPQTTAQPWGPTPVPSNTTVDPDLVATNGYDFRNNQYGDTYVFLLGSTLEDWYASRRAFLQLTGPTPLLPDYAFGTWFTWWYPFSEGSAEDNVTRWDKEALPLDVWGLDMNWRNTSDHQDHFYDHPNTVLFPNFTGWFDFLETRKLKTYFNDHPFPVADQTHPEEVAFRTQGLFKWLGEGLTFWWFDRNWKFSIPPPGIAPVGGWNISYTGGDWEGLDNAAWGSHIYFANVDAYNRAHRPSTRTMTLTKWASRDYHESLPGSLHPQESLAQHRYPVWWTGDDITLEASVDTMIRAGLHGLKPYVHSDCGGDYRPKLSAGNLLRWTGVCPPCPTHHPPTHDDHQRCYVVQHCVFAPILRFHGADHRPWSYGQGPLATIKSYLQLRYRLAPSLVAAAADTGSAATPLVARCDMFWPTFSEAASTTQYIFLNDFLVAPITDTVHNETSRSVWIPPGSWECIWSGETVTGPKTIKVTAPYERQPAWHRRGGLVVTSDDKALRLEDQDWSLLTIHAFPADADLSATRRIVDHGTLALHSHGDAGAATGVGASAGTMLTATSSASAWSLDIEPHPNGTPRAWHLRLHLAPTQHFVAAKVDGHDAEATLVGPADASSPPLAPRGVAPPPSSGAIVDIPLPPSAEGRRVQVLLR